MLRTSGSTIVHGDLPYKMKYGQFKVDQIITDFEHTVHADGFTNIVYTFLTLNAPLTNPKLDDYKHMFDTFQQQHYHEFLFHYKQRNKRCQAFIQTMKDFDQHKKPKKKEYQALVKTLSTYKDVLGTLPGGHLNGVPFIFTQRLVEHWFFDQVVALRKRLSLQPPGLVPRSSESLIYPVEEDNKWSGHTRCPANRLVSTKMSFSFAVYLIRVGYETQDTVKEKWSLDIPDRAVKENWQLGIPHTTEEQHNWVLFQEDTEEVHPILSEIQSVQQTVSATVVRRLHCGQNPQEINEACREQIVDAYDFSIQQRQKNNKRKYDQFKETQERALHTTIEENKELKAQLQSVTGILRGIEKENADLQDQLYTTIDASRRTGQEYNRLRADYNQLYYVLEQSRVR